MVFFTFQKKKYKVNKCHFLVEKCDCVIVCTRRRPRSPTKERQLPPRRVSHPPVSPITFHAPSIRHHFVGRHFWRIIFHNTKDSHTYLQTPPGAPFLVHTHHLCIAKSLTHHLLNATFTNTSFHWNFPVLWAAFWAYYRKKLIGAIIRSFILIFSRIRSRSSHFTLRGFGVRNRS